MTRTLPDIYILSEYKIPQNNIQIITKRKVKFALLNERGKFYSEDREKRFVRLTGHALKEYLKSPEGKKKRFYVGDEE